MSRVLVTGASGFVGSHLARRLLQEGHQVAALMRPTADRTHLEGLGISFVEGDVQDPASLAGAMEGCGTVFHAAAGLGMWRGTERLQHEVNVTGTRNVCAAARTAGVGRLVHTSSVAAVGFPPEGETADESSPFSAESASFTYPRSKHLAEIEVQRAVEDGLDAVIVNPGVIYGIRPNRHYAANLFESLVAGRVPVAPAGGLCWVGIADVVEGHLLAWRKGRRGARYILGAENLPHREFMRRVCRVAGSRPPFLTLPRAAALPVAWSLERISAFTGRHPVLSMDMAWMISRHVYYRADLAGRELGWRPTPLEKAVAALLGKA